jgi:type III pantothenate kinase
MVFTADLSNSGITMAVFDADGTLVFRSNISSDRNKSEDEYYILLQSIFNLYGVNPRSVEGAIISSVVPPLLNVLNNAVVRLLGCKQMDIRAAY